MQCYQVLLGKKTIHKCCITQNNIIHYNGEENGAQLAGYHRLLILSGNEVQWSVEPTFSVHVLPKKKIYIKKTLHHCYPRNT